MAGLAGERNGTRVLVVEDHTMSRRALLKLLGHIGFDADGAGTVAEGREKLAAFKPEILILDLMLPDGNGMEILREIRAQRLPVRVAVVSGATEPMLGECTKIGPDALFGKPIEVSGFEAWLREQMSLVKKSRRIA